MDNHIGAVLKGTPQAGSVDAVIAAMPEAMASAPTPPSSNLTRSSRMALLLNSPNSGSEAGLLRIRCFQVITKPAPNPRGHTPLLSGSTTAR